MQPHLCRYATRSAAAPGTKRIKDSDVGERYPSSNIPLPEGADWPKCIAICYAVVDPAVWEAMGASLPKALDPLEALQDKTGHTPALFIAEAGKDHPALKAGLQRFISTANESGWSPEYWNHPAGEHGFETRTDDERSRAIILRTMDFLEENLSSE